MIYMVHNIPPDGLYLSLWRGLIPAPRGVELGRSCRYLSDSVLDYVLSQVTRATGIRRRQILGASRKAPIARARQMVMYLLRARRDPSGRPCYSYPHIAARLGGLDHTTVMHGVRRHQARLDAQTTAEAA